MDNATICPVCKSQNTAPWSVARDYEYLSTEESYPYYKCDHCDSIYIHPLPADQLMAIYPSNYYSFGKGRKNWAFRIKEWMDERLLRKLLKGIKGNTINVLDAGGGTGWLLDLIKKIDPRVAITQVVDIDSSARQIAESNGHLYFEGRIEDFTSPHRFDLVLMLNLIEHVSDPGKVLQRVQSYLNPEGIILIKTPNTRSLDASLFKKTYWGGLHCPRHWIIFSEKSFRILLKETGLGILSLKYTQGGPFWAFSIIVFLSRKKILKVSRERPVIYHPLFPLISSAFAAFDFIRRPFAKTSQLFIVLKKSNQGK